MPPNFKEMLPRKKRINLKKEEFKEDKRLTYDSFDLLIKKRRGKKFRLATIVPKGRVKKAVRRNKIRRIITAAVRGIQDEIPPFDILFIVKKDISREKPGKLAQTFLDILAKVEK